VIIIIISVIMVVIIVEIEIGGRPIDIDPPDRIETSGNDIRRVYPTREVPRVDIEIVMT